jgi:uncharacterized repeat protein (TIGR01451 family)
VIVVLDPNEEEVIDWPNPDGSRITITFPVGVVDEQITIIFNSLLAPSSAPNGFRFAGIAFTLDAYRSNVLIDDFNFRNQGIEVTLTYTDAAIAGLNEDALVLYYFDEDTGTWKSDGITLVSHDKANNRIVFNVTHLTEFALFAPTVAPVTPTVTPTATPTDDGDDDGDGDGDDGTSEEGLGELIGGPWIGNYCMAAGGVGLQNNSSGTFAMNVVGTPVQAFLIWAGRYPDNTPDGTIQISINGSAPITVNAVDDRQSELPGGVSYFTFRSADLVTLPAFAGLLNGALNITVSGLDSGNGAEGYGVGLKIVSSSPSCPFSQINLYFGLDSFAPQAVTNQVVAAGANRVMAPQGSLGPNSAVLCAQFPAGATARPLNFQAFVAGVDPGQSNALWYQVGAGALPTELITNQFGMVLDGPPVTVASPFKSNAGPQLDNYTNSITVPAGATFACFQIQSTPSTGGAATEAVWLSFISQLTNAIVPPPTVTPTPTVLVTPTPTRQATATPMPTPTPTVTGVPTLPPVPGFALNISVTPLNPAAGENLTYRLAYQNNGTTTINNLVLRLTVPQYTTWSQALSSAGWSCSNNGQAGAECSYTIASIPPGAVGEVRFVVTLDSNLPLTVQAIRLAVRAEGADQVVYAEKEVVVTPKISTTKQLFIPYVRR